MPSQLPPASIRYCSLRPNVRCGSKAAALTLSRATERFGERRARTDDARNDAALAARPFHLELDCIRHHHFVTWPKA